MEEEQIFVDVDNPAAQQKVEPVSGDVAVDLVDDAGRRESDGPELCRQNFVVELYGAIVSAHARLDLEKWRENGPSLECLRFKNSIYPFDFIFPVSDGQGPETSLN
jgi:hypothetical protein